MMPVCLRRKLTLPFQPDKDRSNLTTGGNALVQENIGDSLLSARQHGKDIDSAQQDASMSHS
jgi:hypothetical protein